MLRHLPNALCIVRMLMVAPLIWLLANEGNYPVGAGGLFCRRIYRWAGWVPGQTVRLALVAGRHSRSPRGQIAAGIYIPDADLYRSGAAVVVDRGCRQGSDLIILGGVAYRIFIGTVVAQPTTISKLNSACQLLYVLLVVANAGYGVPGPINRPGSCHGLFWRRPSPAGWATCTPGGPKPWLASRRDRS